MAFGISGRDNGRFVSMTRNKAASAVLLADRWMQSGFNDVRIDWNGRLYDLPAFRRLLVFRGSTFKPRDLVSI